MSKPKPKQTERLERFHTKPVHYQWATPDGTVHHHSTVVLAKSKGGLRQAIAKFFIDHSHVSPAHENS